MTTTFLLNDFYTIESTESVELKITAIVLLNNEHPIFKGHFEQMPVVPGVCQTQMIKEIIQLTLKQNLTLIKGDNIKFMSMIIPSQNPKIQIEINYKQTDNTIIVDARLFHENTIFTKFKGNFTTANFL